MKQSVEAVTLFPKFVSEIACADRPGLFHVEHTNELRHLFHVEHSERKTDRIYLRNRKREIENGVLAGNAQKSLGFVVTPTFASLSPPECISGATGE